MAVKFRSLVAASLEINHVRELSNDHLPKVSLTIQAIILRTSSQRATASGRYFRSAKVAPIAATDSSNNAGVSPSKKVGLCRIGNIGWNFSKYKSTKSDKVSSSGKSSISGMSQCG